MNTMKRAFEETELAFSILFKIKAIKSCPAHGEYYYDTGMEKNTVFRFSSAEYKRQNKTALVPQSFRDSVDSVLKEAGHSSNCPFCQKAFSE